MDNEKKMQWIFLDPMDAVEISDVGPTEPANWWVVEIEKRQRHEEKAEI